MSAERPFLRVAVSGDKSEKVLIDLRWEHPLSDADKIAATEELSKLKPLVEAGQISPLYSALSYFKMWQLVPPDWLYDAVFELIHKETSRNRRGQAKERQHSIDLIRWATVKYYRESVGLTWEAAYDAASRKLQGSPAGGNEETIRASYKRHQHDGYIELLRRHDGAEAVGRYAREIYEDREKLMPRRP